MKFTSSIVTLGFVAFAAAQTNNTTAYVGAAVTTDCSAALSACQGSGDPNEAACAASNAECKAECQTNYDTCRGGADANEATCGSEFAGCLGENPFASNGTNTVTSTASAASATAVSGAVNSTVAACETAYDSCRTGPDANHAYCASQYAGCLGENPFASNGTNTVTPLSSLATAVVTAYTTYCPAATVLTFNGKAYTVSSATTLTITDCPCTITTAVSSTGGAVASKTTASVVEFTGAANRASVAGVAGLLAAAAYII